MSAAMDGQPSASVNKGRDGLRDGNVEIVEDAVNPASSHEEKGEAIDVEARHAPKVGRPGTRW